MWEVLQGKKMRDLQDEAQKDAREKKRE